MSLAETHEQQSVQGDSNLRTIQGVVTTFCTDYGRIDGSIYFNTDVTGSVPLKASQKVTTLVEEYKASPVESNQILACFCPLRLREDNSLCCSGPEGWDDGENSLKQVISMSLSFSQVCKAAGKYNP
ncbi:cancer/testis antigen 55-like isoform X2 [Marmota marmota marmota]|uniref:cancer/testis antigen 55-like isoform X2 n=1 Tax=Marmota marmota marmota TaxID=9994 RepID=UPI00209381F2|nr:cancer/testis antigen 55-like isoform X2 [Marmota marmota marmota]